MVNTTRSTVRQKRRALTQVQQEINAVALSKQLRSFLRLKKYRHIAVYLPSDGELSPLHLIQSLNKRTQFYLPILSQLFFQGLKFGQYNSKTPLKPNKFKILEPSISNRKLKRAVDLDIILLPLVAYDLEGNRMGMGGGYYDRALQMRKRRKNWRKPLLIGLAHTIQRVEKINNQSWDVPLDGIATEMGIVLF